MKHLLFALLFLFSASASLRAQDEAATSQKNDLSAYVGTYTFEENGNLKAYAVTLENGDLHGEADSYGKFKLLKQKEADTFQSTSQYASMIVFSRDPATNAITGLTLKLMGNELKATKDKKP